jgi:hypothetical protein
MNRKIPRMLVLLAAALVVVCAPSNTQTTGGTQSTTPPQAQRPRGRGPGRAQGAANQATTPNAATAENEAADTGSDVVQLRPQDLPQSPLRVGINNAIQQGMQGAKPNPAATLTLHTVAGNSAQIAVPSAESTSAAGAQNAAANVAPSAKQNRAASALQSAAPNTQAAAATTQPPPQYRLAITAMQTAMGDLNKAGNKWGGHKATAVNAINQALTTCGGSANQPGAANSAAADPSSAMQDAITQLTSAKNHLGKATNDWGGRREKAISAIDQALSELQAGVDYAKSHTN